MNIVTTIKGTITNDAFYFTLDVNGYIVDNMVLDTGAFELIFNGYVANALRLPNLGAIQIEGVGGSAQAYESVCNLEIGNQTYLDVPCIVAPGLEDAGLFGLRFFVNNKLALLLEPNFQTLTILSS